MKRSLMLKMSVVGAVVAFGAFADDRDNKDINIKAGKADTAFNKAADASFVEQAAVLGQAEVKLSELAVKQATAPAVKVLAQQMVDEHTKSNKALRELAQTKGFAWPSDYSTSSGVRDAVGSDSIGTSMGIGESGSTGSGSTEYTSSGSSRGTGTTIGNTGNMGNMGGNTGTTGRNTVERDITQTQRENSGTVGSPGIVRNDDYAGAGSTSADTSGVGSTGSDDKNSIRKGTGLGPVDTNSGQQLSSAQRSAKTKYNEIAKLSGDRFDKAYLSALVDDHKKAINVFENEAKSGKDAELKTWASNTLPTLRQHQEMIQDVEKNFKNRNSNM